MQIIESSSVAGVIKRSFDRPGRNWIKHIVFPDFQRPYCWSLNDIQKILDDIDELRYSPDEERYREEDEYYLGAICIMPLRDSDSPEHAHDMALLDGQQRLTSLMILARVLYERAMRSKTDVLRSYGANIAWIMGRNLVWKRAFLYQEPATLQHIRQIYFALDREYRQLEADAALDDAPARSPAISLHPPLRTACRQRTPEPQGSRTILSGRKQPRTADVSPRHPQGLSHAV